MSVKCVTTGDPVGRLCKVEEEYGYLLIWEHYAKTIEASPFCGGAPAGQFSQLFGIVQFEDRVRRVDPTDIVFFDEIAAMLHTFNEHEKEKTSDEEV